MQHGWKYIMSVAAVIAAVAMLVEALQPAYAINTPNISMGSNPIDSFYKGCSGQTDVVVFTNNSGMDFVITDIVIYNGAVSLDIGSQVGSPTEFIGGYASYGYDQRFQFTSGIVVGAGESLYCTDQNAYPELTISGYYSH